MKQTDAEMKHIIAVDGQNFTVNELTPEINLDYQGAQMIQVCRDEKGKYFVSNAMNGYGDNNFEEYQGKEVLVYTLVDEALSTKGEFTAEDIKDAIKFSRTYSSGQSVNKTQEIYDKWLEQYRKRKDGGK